MTNISAYIVESFVGLPTRDWDCKCSVCRRTSQDEFWHSSRKPQRVFIIIKQPWSLKDMV